MFASYPRFAWAHGHVREYAVGKALSLALHARAFGACGYGLAPALALFHLVSLLGTALLLATFTVSHTTTDAHAAHKGWLHSASENTVNVRDHWLTNWWMGYLNFQIEHHLFPSMPQFRQPQIAPRVRGFLRVHGLPYAEKGFWSAHADVYRKLRDVARA